LPFGYQTGVLNEAIGQRRFTMIDVGDNTEITYLHGFCLKAPSRLFLNLSGTGLHELFGLLIKPFIMLVDSCSLHVVCSMLGFTLMAGTLLPDESRLFKACSLLKLSAANCSG